jgi:hypothetical protein
MLDCTDTMDPPGMPSAAFLLKADFSQSSANMTVVINHEDGGLQEAGTKTYSGSTKVGGEIAFALSPECRGPLGNNQPVTCAGAQLTHLLLDSDSSFDIVGKKTDQLRLLLEKDTFVQAVTTANKTVLTIPSNTVFGASATNEATGRIGDDFLTSGTPLLIIVDWTNRTFSLPQTKILNAQKSAFIELALGGSVANQPPRANAGEDQLIECKSTKGTEVKLSGSKTTDPDGQNDIASYRWDWAINGVQAAALGVDLTLDVPLGTFGFSLTVHDNHGAADVDGVVVISHDTTAPELTLTSPSPSCLWSPNHKVVLYQLGKDLGFTVSDACDASPKVEIVNVASNQPMNMGPDFAWGKSGLCLRSERVGSIGDRLYTITIKATDASQNFTTKSVVVRVPHDQANDCTKVDTSRLVDINDPRCTAN